MSYSRLHFKAINSLVSEGKLTPLCRQFIQPDTLTRDTVGVDGFEPPKLAQQIYSLSHLATLVHPRN